MRLIWIMDNDYRDMGFGSETFGAYSYIAPQVYRIIVMFSTGYQDTKTANNVVDSQIKII